MSTFFRLAVAALVLCVSAVPAFAQGAFPSKTMRIFVGAPPGGSNDIFARPIAQRLSEIFGQPVVVDNRPGANQMIAADLTAKAPPDGTTLYMTSMSYTTGAALMPKLPFDPVADLTGVTMVGKGPMVIVVHPSVPAKNMKEFIAIARAKPDALNFTTSGIGSNNHLGVEVLMSMTKIKMVHVPHKGMAPALTDLMAGQAQMLLISLPSVEAQMKSGRLRAIGITSPKRSSFLPDMPTVAETVPGYEHELWWGLFTAAKTPKAALDRLNSEIRKIIVTDEMKKRFTEFGAESAPTSPEEFSAIVKNEIAKWTKVVKEANIKAE